MKAFDGSVLTKDDTEVWIGETDGYPSAERSRSTAKRFKSEEAVRAAALLSDGMPWYFRFKEGTLKIFKVTETRIIESTEEEVI